MDSRTRRVVATLAVPAFMIGTDFTGAMMLVVPIEHEFSVDITTTQWVLNMYALTFAMGLVAGGNLGDMFGRRRFLLNGLAIFFLASLACTVAPSISWLIAARAVQGVGTAIAWPLLLAIAATAVEEEERGYVMGLIIAVVGLGNVISPLFAGVLGGLGKWRLFFFINVVLAAASALFVWLFLPKDVTERSDERIDYGGMIVLSLAVLILLYALDVGSDWGWGSLPLVGLFLLCAALFVAFPFVENHVADAMVPRPMMHNRQFMLVLSTNGLLTPAAFLLLLYTPQYLHKVLGWPVLWASMGMLTILVAMTVVSLKSGRLYNSVGPRRLLATGCGLAAMGSICLIVLSPSWGYMGLVPPMLLIGVGSGLVFGPAGTASVNAAGPSRAGLAGGLSFMFHLGLGAVGVGGGTAIMFGSSLTSLQGGLTQSGVTMSAADQLALNGGVAHGQAAQIIMAQYSPEIVQKIESILREAFTTGLHQAFWLGLAFAVIGVIVSLCIDEKKLRDVDTQGVGS